MIQYRLSQKFPHDSFLQVEMSLKPPSSPFELKLPDWRPGRYQLGNFSKYLRNFKAYDPKGNQLKTEKTNKNTWKIHPSKEECIIKYEIYTSTIDGGSTYVDEEHWYLNFINCMLYVPDHMYEVHEVTLEIPEQWIIACGLKREGKILTAESFYQLVDNPVLAGANMQHLQYQVEDINFHLWFRGDVNLQNEDQILDDFKKFTSIQLKTMGDFENSDYHFLFQMPDEKAYHGVEHLNSTCIVLGPAKDFHKEDFYNNFLGISSHELFHYWNIIRIRPEEMYPYNFEHENYFRTGYVAEGVTTYYGDLFLVRGGVKDLNWYKNELNILFKRHFENYGRFNTSVADSSWDLWLDGYEAGIPHRKVSIYVKGALIALILDLKILLETKGEKRLDDVMRLLWTDFYKRDKGYSQNDYLKTAEKVIGHELTEYSKDFIEGCAAVEDELKVLLPQFGFYLEEKSNENKFAQHFGFKVNGNEIISIAPNSPAEESLRIGDHIISFNHQKFDSEIEIISDGKHDLEVFRGHQVKSFKLSADREKFYESYTILEKENISEEEQFLRKRWLNI